MLNVGPKPRIEYVIEPDCAFFSKEVKDIDEMFDRAEARGYERHENGGHRCERCGSRITWTVLVQDANGDVFVLGRTCAKEVCDGNVKLGQSRAKSKLRDFFSSLTIEHEGFREWAKSQPHPKGWENRTRLGDLVYWNKRGGDVQMETMREAWKEYQEHVGKVPA